jgi:hypothetical protein
MTRTAPVAAIAAVLALAGCSSDDDSSDSGSGSGAETGQEQAQQQQQQQGEKGQKPEKKDPQSCEVRGINVVEGRTGTCNLNDKRFTLVNRRQTLELSELNARFLKITADDSLTGPVGEVPAEKGSTFVLARIMVTNNSPRRRRFNADFRQVRFRLAGQSYPTAQNGESAVPGSFFNQNRVLPPGGTQRGTVVFKAKAGVEDGFFQRGVDPQLLFWNWSTASGEEGPDGGIRLWQ